MRMATIAAAAILLCVAVGVVAQEEKSAPEKSAQKQDAAESIEALLKQRRDVVHQLVETLTDQYRQGVVSYDSVVRASEELIDAELDLARTREERLVLLQRQVNLMRSYEAVASKLFSSGTAAHSDVLRSRAAVLEARIELARERAAPER